MLDHFKFKDPALVHCRNIKFFSEPMHHLSYFKDANLQIALWYNDAFIIKVTSGDQLRLNYVSGASQLD